MNTRNIFKVALVSEFLIGALMSPLANGGWTRKADMPTARTGLAACVVDGRVYAIGGGPANQTLTSTVEQYDPATDTWTKKASMRTPRTFFGAGVVSGKIYAFGGYGYLSSLEEYDPAADTWTTRAPMPTGRDHLSCAVVDGTVYAIGGKIGGSTTCIPTVEAYDPGTDTWTRKADMLAGRGSASCTAVDGILYVLGGAHTGGTGVDRAVSTVEAYDPATDTWTTKTPMLTARCFFSTCVVNGRVYAIGGCSNAYDSSELSSVEAYDPATDTWQKMLDMQVRRKSLASAAVNGKIYALGGVSGAGWDPALSTVEEYDLTPPPPDFNGDGTVDIKDLLRLIQSWGQDDPAVDIGPGVFGDGVIDAADLEILMSYWGQEIGDPTLIAHWSLDETEGAIASDSAGGHDGRVVGLPMWQPASGQIGGAMQFDGATLIAADTVLDPADGPFSVLAWIKGGAPGQVILSQTEGANWLAAETVTGALMTELKGSGRHDKALASATIITDGDWHRLAFTWDGVNRRLYVDGVLVAKDAQERLAGSTGDLLLAVDKTLTPGTFWTGLIDDVRVYNRAVRP